MSGHIEPRLVDGSAREAATELFQLREAWRPELELLVEREPADMGRRGHFLDGHAGSLLALTPLPPPGFSRLERTPASFRALSDNRCRGHALTHRKCFTWRAAQLITRFQSRDLF